MRDRTSSSSRPVKPQAKVRVIGGKWRGRWIRFNDAEGLRPTGDRMRETLFNWLQNSIPSARCLDLFAGTGALGIEAISRGAATSVLVEHNPAVCRQLRLEIDTLTANQPDDERRISVHAMTAETYLQGKAATDGLFNIVFIDPPFAHDVQLDVLALLQQPGLLAADALVYVEAPASSTLEARLPATYDVCRKKTQGKVQCLLLRSHPVTSPSQP